MPVPTAGTFPAIVAVVAQTLCEGPALAVVGLASCWIRTVEVDGGHTPLLIVHSKTLLPTPKFTTPELGERGVMIIPGPLSTFHIPKPTLAVFAARVALVEHTV